MYHQPPFWLFYPGFPSVKYREKQFLSLPRLAKFEFVFSPVSPVYLSKQTPDHILDYITIVPVNLSAWLFFDPVPGVVFIGETGSMMGYGPVQRRLQLYLYNENSMIKPPIALQE